MRRQNEGFAIPSDAEWSTYDVILLSSRLGARPNPLQIGNTPSFTTGSSVIRKRSEQVFGGISTYKSASRQEIKHRRDARPPSPFRQFNLSSSGNARANLLLRRRVDEDVKRRQLTVLRYTNVSASKPLGSSAVHTTKEGGRRHA